MEVIFQLDTCLFSTLHNCAYVMIYLHKVSKHIMLYVSLKYGIRQIDFIVFNTHSEFDVCNTSSVDLTFEPSGKTVLKSYMIV